MRGVRLKADDEGRRRPRLARLVPLALIALLVAAPVASAVDVPVHEGSLQRSGSTERTVSVGVGAVSWGMDGCAVRSLVPNDEACSSDPEEPSERLVDPDPDALTDRVQIPTPRWYAAVADAGQDRMVRVHGFGDVAMMTADGDNVWVRPSMSFYPDWNRTPYVVPFVALAYGPTDPDVLGSDHPYGVGDLTGDGLEDVAVAHLVRDDEALRVVSEVSVLDGRDGSTVWHRTHDGVVTQVHILGDRLVVGAEDGPPRSLLGARAGDGRPTTIHGYRLEGAPLTSTAEWTHVPGPDWAVLTSARRTADGLAVAVAHDDGSQVVHLGPEGAVRWTKDLADPPVLVRHDASRNLVLLQTLPGSDASSYRIRAFEEATGRVAHDRTREEATLLSLAVADVAGGPRAEWIHAEVSSGSFPTGREPVGSVHARTPDDTLWSHAIECPDCADLPLPVSLRPVDGGVAVGILVGSSGQLAMLDGSSGTPRWHVDDGAPFPVFGGTVDGELAALTPGMIVKVHDPRSGKARTDRPLVYEIHDAAVHDVDGDGGSDLLVGGASGTIFALDGDRLGPDPAVLWTARLDGGVHHLELADLDGTGPPELVAVASRTVAALDVASGRPLYRIHRPDAYLWTAAVDDVDGDGLDDVVVPSDTLTAYRGTDGRVLWDHDPMPDVTNYFATPVVADGTVVSQYLVSVQERTFAAPRHHHAVVALSGDGAVEWRDVRVAPGHARLWRSVTKVLGPEGPRVAVTYAAGRTTADPTSASVERYGGPVVDLYDVSNGSRLAQIGPLRIGGLHMATVHHPSSGLTELNWMSTAHLDVDGISEAPGEGASDVAFADAGQGRTVTALSWVTVRTYADFDVERGLDEHSTWNELMTGGLTVADWDRDGGQELVAHPFDWPAWRRVAAFAGISSSGGDILPHGVAVLDIDQVPSAAEDPADAPAVPGPGPVLVGAAAALALLVVRRR